MNTIGRHAKHQTAKGLSISRDSPLLRVQLVTNEHTNETSTFPIHWCQRQDMVASLDKKPKIISLLQVGLPTQSNDELQHAQ